MEKPRHWGACLGLGRPPGRRGGAREGGGWRRWSGRGREGQGRRRIYRRRMEGHDRKDRGQGRRWGGRRREETRTRGLTPWGRRRRRRQKSPRKRPKRPTHALPRWLAQVPVLSCLPARPLGPRPTLRRPSLPSSLRPRLHPRPWKSILGRARAKAKATERSTGMDVGFSSRGLHRRARATQGPRASPDVPRACSSPTDRDTHSIHRTIRTTLTMHSTSCVEAPAHFPLRGLSRQRPSLLPPAVARGLEGEAGSGGGARARSLPAPLSSMLILRGIPGRGSGPKPGIHAGSRSPCLRWTCAQAPFAPPLSPRPTTAWPVRMEPRAARVTRVPCPPCRRRGRLAGFPSLGRRWQRAALWGGQGSRKDSVFYSHKHNDSSSPPRRRIEAAHQPPRDWNGPSREQSRPCLLTPTGSAPRNPPGRRTGRPRVPRRSTQ